MLKDIKTLCNIQDMHKIINLLEQESYSIEQIKKLYYNDLNIIKNIEDTIYFLSLIGIIVEKNGSFYALIKINTLNELSCILINGIIETKIFDGFHVKNEYYMKIELNYYPIRNFLLNSEIIRKTELTSIYIIEINHIEKRNKPKSITLEELKEKLEIAEKIGEQAEEIVLDFEKRRLDYKVGIEKVSEDDASLGFDIISYNDINDSYNNRYIEVKAITDYQKFYLSRNEIYKSSILGENYYLYLVYIKNYKEPIIIQNPYKTIFNDSSIPYTVENISYNIDDIFKT
ncbi:DUF3883 domain-containing protein [Mammaliicoccus lentus]|uniref:DUF3883 domain-containing protein n=1 Tax=Mammaliicoccus lentus TaxID=42858 RepID=UPI001B319031|nr:DUF3883 domain-containing protein [Mammaliicoccus lentus]